jgi:membrane-bound lytic murein transglycosylase F
MFLMVFILCGDCNASIDYSSKYDPLINKYTKRFFGIGFDQRIIKALMIKESSLNPNAVSKVGAQGLMQIMPATWREIKGKCPIVKGSPLDPSQAIPAGIFYLSTLHNQFKDTDIIMSFALAAYNAGAGRVREKQRLTQKKGNDPLKWNNIKFLLPKETQFYVVKIYEIRDLL